MTFYSKSRLFAVLPAFLGEISLDDSRIKVEAAAVEEDVGLESFTVAVTAGFLHEALNLVVDAFGERFG